MNIILKFRDEYTDEVFDFMEALVDTCGANFTFDEDKEEELENIRDSLIANDCALHELISIKPEHEASYRQQYDQARQALADRVLRLKIIGVFVESKEQEVSLTP